MDFVLIKGYFYFFMLAGAAGLMVWYIWYLYSNKERSERYETYSNLALNDELDDALVDAREVKSFGSKVDKKDE